MKIMRRRYALSMVAAAALLAGCAQTQPPMATSGGIPESRGIAVHGAGRGSWMLPEANGADLLYVAHNFGGGSSGDVYVFTLKTGRLVGDLRQAPPFGECADRRGDVFVVSQGQEIFEYRHAGTLKSTLTTPNGSNSCSVDPTTGNLAVANYGGVLIYQHAQGSPTTYTGPNFTAYSFCGYDSSGNLFVDGHNGSDGFVFGELPKGGTSISPIVLNSPIKYPGQVQWDGKYLAIADGSTNVIGRYSVSGSQGLLRAKTLLDPTWTEVDFWIQGSLLVASAGRVFNGYSFTQVQYYRYPAGGRHPTMRYPRDGYIDFGVAVSLARH